MVDLEKKLEDIRGGVDTLLRTSATKNDSWYSPEGVELNIFELMNILWHQKWLLLGITFTISALAAFYALTSPKFYRSEGVYAPAKANKSLSGIASQYGGLAAIAGIDIGGESSDIEQAILLMESWPFLETFIKKHNLEALLFAVDGWDAKSKQIIYDEDLYDPDKKIWMHNSESERSFEPTSFELYKTITNLLTVNYQSKTGMINISFETMIPELSAEWVTMLVGDVNEHFQRRDMVEAQRNIDYLEAKVVQTGIAEMKAVFYNMIESQTKSLMLAEVSDEYLLKTVVPPKVPEQRSKPKRTLIVLIGGVIGVVIGVCFVFLKELIFANFMKKID